MMMDCTPDHDRWAAISMSWLNAGMDQPLAMPPMRSSLPSPCYMENLDSSLTMQCVQWRRSQPRCLWSHSRWRRICTSHSWTSVRTQDRYQFRYRFRTFRAVMRLPKYRIICILRRGAEINPFSLTIRCKCRSSRSVGIFCLPTRFLWLDRPCCLLRCRT